MQALSLPWGRDSGGTAAAHAEVLGPGRFELCIGIQVNLNSHRTGQSPLEQQTRSRANSMASKCESRLQTVQTLLLLPYSLSLPPEARAIPCPGLPTFCPTLPRPNTHTGPGSRGNLFFPQLTKQGVRGRPRVRIHHIGRQPACADWSPEELRWADASWTASDSGGTASDTDSQAEEEDDEEEPSGAPATRHVRWADQQQEGERARGPSVHLGPPCAGRV